MQKILTLVALLFSTILLFAQSDETEKQFTLPQVGWTFTPPTDFKLFDSSSNSFSPTPEIKTWRKQLMFKYDKNILILSISSSTQQGIDWDNIHKKEEKHFFD